MTEAEWLDCSSPLLMLEYLRGSMWNRVIRRLAAIVSERVAPASDRKLRLFATACFQLIPDTQRVEDLTPVFEMAERFADGAATRTEREAMDAFSRDYFGGSHLAAGAFQIQADPWEAARREADVGARYSAAIAFNWGGHPEWERVQATQLSRYADLLRCIVGNPFRPVAFEARWRTEVAVSLATGIYADRAFDRLPILADALEEAGCDHPDVLNHCRGPGPHARGCWVVDGVLGKS